jgi:hypothetical protein
VLRCPPPFSLPQNTDVISSPFPRLFPTAAATLLHPTVVFGLALIALLPACGTDAVDGSDHIEAKSDSESGEGMLWEAPDLPGPYAMTLDGVDVPQLVLREFLRPDWNRHFLSLENNADEISDARFAEITTSFYSSPQTLLQPLIRDLLLVRKHEGDHGDVDAHDFEHFVEEFDANAGGSRSVLLSNLGEEGLRNHLLRRFRLRAMMKEFNAITESVTEAEIKAYFDSQYDRVLADMMANSSVSQAEAEKMLTLEDPRVHEMIEGQLQLQRIEQTVDQWIADLAEDTKVTFAALDGKEMVIPVKVAE